MQKIVRAVHVAADRVGGMDELISIMLTVAVMGLAMFAIGHLL